MNDIVQDVMKSNYAAEILLKALLLRNGNIVFTADELDKAHQDGRISMLAGKQEIILTAGCD